MEEGVGGAGSKLTLGKKMKKKKQLVELKTHMVGVVFN
jgi:hypothetical protein